MTTTTTPWRIPHTMTWKKIPILTVHKKKCSAKTFLRSLSEVPLEPETAEARFWGQPGEMSMIVRAEPPAVLEPPPLLRTASRPEATANPVASPSRSRVAYHPYRSQSSSAFSDTTDSTSTSGSFRRESTDGPETRDAPRGFPRSQTSHSRATSIAIIEDMRTGTPLYDMNPTQVREEQRRQLRAQYWNERQDDIEAAYLIRVARAYLGIPATSSESEQSFSRAGRILGTNRYRMHHTTFRNLMRIYRFNKFFCRFPHYLNPGYLYWH
ncbi:hypothetical protein BGZ96_012109 [Linnemannia gamsii]|uniref:HAT C-terminal dimerisation domain-containing protein n=1 Tax=Linnemannia gamsii TaxID=64522 RepID=A0ABQ7JQY9_9FUNG|nr:hypothetical protein BGZ96_012109 [Linnemannia gamsii]